MTQTTLWLLPLLLGSLFGIVSALKMGWRWSWGVVVQHGIVFAIAISGLYFIPKWDWLCAYLGWGFMLGYTVVARTFLTKMTQALGLLRTTQAISKARLLCFIMWGPPGRFWLDLAYMINCYLRGDIKSANFLYKKWTEFGLPKSISDSLTAYAMIGLIVMRDWHGAVEKYEEARSRYEAELAAGKKNIRFPFQIAMPAMRAFAELRRFSEARQALLLADLPAVSYGRESLETLFLSYFALLGAEEDSNELLDSMKGNKAALPEHARLYWQARCASERQYYELAILMLEASLRITPEKDTAWRSRTQYQIKLNQENIELGIVREPNPVEDAEKTEAAKTGRQVMKRCLAVSEILNSRTPPTAVRFLTGVISVMFIYSYYPFLLNEKTSFAFNFGYLSGPLLMSGQWWRLISYLFLHGSISHLMMNLFGLVWFGRFVENIFGTWRFLAIFVLSGVLSGALQVIMSSPDDKAVGASGAILGIFGAGLAATLRLKNVLPKQIRRQELSWMIALAVTQLVFDQVVNFLYPGSENVRDAVHIAAAAHFGGMLSGFVLGWTLALRKLGTEE